MCPRADRRVWMERTLWVCTDTWWLARACGQKSAKWNIFGDYDSRPHKFARSEVRCKKELVEDRMLKVPKLLPGVSCWRSAFSGSRNLLSSKEKCKERQMPNAKHGKRKIKQPGVGHKYPREEVTSMTKSTKKRSTFQHLGKELVRSERSIRSS